MARKITVIAVIICVVLTALSIALTNFFKYKNEVESNDLKELQQVEDKIKNSLTTLDKAYSMFDKKTTDEMIAYSTKVKQLYEQTEDYKEIDLDTLSNEFEMDIYLINEQYEIVHSNNNKDLGLNFSKCCPKLISTLEESREKGKFVSPGIDVEQTTGKIKKFSYEGTDDGKFIIELGYSLENDDVFDEFGFIEDINEIEEDFSSIENIRVLNIGGLPIGEKQEKLSPQNREAFEEALQTKETVDIVSVHNDKEIKYRYIYHDSDVMEGRISQKIIELTYNHDESKQMIRNSFNILIIQIIIVVIITILVTIVAYYWISKNVYMAHHDRLTGLKNRTAF